MYGNIFKPWHLLELLYIVASDFHTKKIETSEEGEFVNDLRVCEKIFKIKFLQVRFSCFRNRENNIFKNKPSE